MAVIMWHNLQQITLSHPVTFHYCGGGAVVVVVVVVAVAVALLTESSVNFPPENSIPPCELESDSVLFTDDDYAIM